MQNSVRPHFNERMPQPLLFQIDRDPCRERTNYELAKLHLRHDRPRDAVAVVRPALRGSIEASNFFLMRTEVHDLLARAWESAGERDSAAAHYREVARAWGRGDAPFVTRASDAVRRLSAVPTDR